MITGLEDSGMDLDVHTDPGPSVKPNSVTRQSEGLTASTPGRSTRLKRRARAGSASDDEIGMLFTMPKTHEEEPPLKKFKELFEATDPSKVDDAPYFESGAGETQSQTQPGSSGASQRTQARPRRALNAVAEEEEEEMQTQTTGTAATAGSKRKASAVESGDNEEDNGSTAEPPASQAKKRAVEANAIRRTPSVSVVAQQAQDPSRSPKKPGAPAGRPDTDAAFLKALASTKRGKRTEDSFDREFNNLRISKPDLESRREEEEVEWRVLEEFGDDGDVRGNFMTVVEMDVYADRAPFLPVQERAQDPRWADRPNFKKFKKVARDAPRTRIELVQVTGDGDGWDASQSQNLADLTLSVEEKKPRRGKAAAKKSQPEEVRYVEISDDDDQPEGEKMDEDDMLSPPPPPPPARTARATRSRSASVQPPTRSQSSRTATQGNRASRAASKQAAPLFLLDSDEDEEQEESMTLPSTAGTLRSRGAPKRKRATQAGSESEDDAPARRPTTRRRAR